MSTYVLAAYEYVRDMINKPVISSAIRHITLNHVDMVSVTHTSMRTWH